MSSHIFCNCYTCRKLRKFKGVVLGTRRKGYFSQGVFGFSNVSEYITHPKFSRGRRPLGKFIADEVLKEY